MFPIHFKVVGSKVKVTVDPGVKNMFLIHKML
jgi:hypothetical protein